MTLKLALVIDGDASGGKRAVQETRAEIRNLGADAKATASAMVAANDQAEASTRRVLAALAGQEQVLQRAQAVANRFAGISLPGSDASYRQRAADVAAYGNELDSLRAKYNPIFAASKEYEQELANIDRAHRVGAISTQEHGAAIAGLNDRYTAQHKIASAGMEGVGRSASLTANQMLNLSRQGNDVITMFALGAPPMQIFASQIGQIYDALESGPRGLKGSLQGIGELAKQAGVGLLGFAASPAGIATGAGIAAVAGVVAYVSSTRKELKDLDVLLKEHRDVLQAIGADYEGIAAKAKDAFSKNSANGLLLASSATQEGMRLQLANQAQLLMPQLGSFVSPGKSAGGYFGVKGEFQPFAEAIENLRKSMREGSPDIIGFRKAIEDRWALEPNNAKLTEAAGKLIEYSKDADTLARALKQLKIAQEQLAQGKQPGGFLSTFDTGSYAQFLAAERVSADRARQAADARRQGIFARSPAEISAAARAQAEAQYNDNESAGARRLRIELAGIQALTQATHALSEAQRERMRSLDESIASARLDVELVGKNAAETARLRMEHQLIAEVRRAADDAGVKADEAEIARIRQKTAEYQKLVALQSARQMLFEQGQELEKLRLETALIGSSTATRERAIALMEAEQRIRREGYETLSVEAQKIRENALAIADHKIALQQEAEAWDSVKRSGESAIDSLLEGDWKSALNDIIKSGIDFNVGNPLKNWIFGSGLPTGADLGNIWGKLFGGADQDAGGLVSSILGGGQNVGAMSVNAGTVMVTGSIGVGGGLGSLAENASRLLSGARGNAASGNTGVMGKVWDFFSGKGLQPHQVAGIMGNVGAESSFNPSALNPSSGAFGIFQHLGSRLGSLGSGAGLNDQLNFAWKELQTSEAGVLKKLLAAPDVRSATSAFAGFERAGGWTKANPEGIELWEQRLAGAQQSLEKFGGTANAANQSLGQFGNGLGQMGNALSQFPGAPGGGAGGILGSLFGGLNSAFSGSKAFKWLSSNPGQFIGLYDEGGYTGDGGKHDVAGIAHKGEFYFSKAATSNIGVGFLNRLHEAGKRGQSFAEGGFTGGTFSAGGMGGRGNAVSGAGGRTVVEIRLTEGLRAELLQQAGDQAVEIVQANQRNREALYQAGDTPR